MVTITDNRDQPVFVGVDTHKDSHTAVVVDINGGMLDTLRIDTSSKGYQRLIDWAGVYGSIESFGVEGTGCYGFNLAEHLTGLDHRVIEVGCVNRQFRRRHGKTDETDALAAARAVASGVENSPAKQTVGNVEIIRVLQMGRCSAVKQRTQVVNQIKALLIKSPETITNQLEGLTWLKQIRVMTGWRPTDYLSNVSDAKKQGLKTLAKRWTQLNNEVKQADKDLEIVLTDTVPDVLDESGVGTDVAAKLVIAAGSNPDRFETETGFAALCGVNPVDASSGKQNRHRLNRGGDRQANNALYTIAITRMNHDPETKKYVTKKTSEGKTRKETIRSLKRHIARQIWKKLKQNLT